MSNINLTTYLDKAIVIDGNNFLHRQLHQPALADMEYNGYKTGAIFGFMRSLLTTIRSYPDHYPVVVFDMGRSPRRLSIYPNYKGAEDREELKREVELGTRPREDLNEEFMSNLINQSEAIKYLLKVMRIPTIQLRGWEGDDLMAILSRMLPQVVLATDDKDMWQLITPTTTIFRPMRTDKDGSKGEVVDYKMMTEWYGDNPHLPYIVSKCLLGDGSDNIPKVANLLGGKTAELISPILVPYMYELVDTPRSDEDRWTLLIDEVIAEVRKVKGGKAIENLYNGFDQFVINMRLMDLSDKFIPNDPVVLNELSNQIEVNQGHANGIEVMSALNTYGIVNFDYVSLLNYLSEIKEGKGIKKLGILDQIRERRGL